MTQHIDEQLRRDARALASLEVSETGQARLEARLNAARQSRSTETIAAPEPRASWQPVALAAAMALAVMIVVRWLPDTDPAPQMAQSESTLPAPTTPTPTVTFDNARALDTVSNAEPLQAEWVALQQDLERAKARIEEDLLVSF